jgi:hypothetical protein
MFDYADSSSYMRFGCEVTNERFVGVLQETAFYGGAGGGRRLLSGGPGSHPPRCTSKCGSCSPCAPVHVSVPPGEMVTTEYYPVAWRCKCRDRLYMP